MYLYLRCQIDLGDIARRPGRYCTEVWEVLHVTKVWEVYGILLDQMYVRYWRRYQILQHDMSIMSVATGVTTKDAVLDPRTKHNRTQYVMDGTT